MKIYFNDKPLFLTTELTPEIVPYSHHDDAILIDELNVHTVKSMIHEMEKSHVHAGIFLHPDIEELKKAFWKKFLVIKAGGGLVKSGKGNYLMIFRRGQWDLPKGKLDEGETIEDCSLREVNEETGVEGLVLDRFLQTTFHTYHQDGKHILKESYWYAMSVAGEPELTPQTEEDISKAVWLSPEQIRPVLGQCFPSVRDVLQHVIAGLSSPHDQ